MTSDAAYQRKRAERKRLMETDEPLIKCLECPLRFRRVGSHVVQVHGYETVLEYRRAHGLMARETRSEGHAKEMRAKASNYENLQNGAPNRYTKGGDHPARLREFWDNREKRLGTRKRNLNLEKGEGR